MSLIIRNRNASFDASIPPLTIPEHWLDYEGLYTAIDFSMESTWPSQATTIPGGGELIPFAGSAGHSYFVRDNQSIPFDPGGWVAYSDASPASLWFGSSTNSGVDPFPILPIQNTTKPVLIIKWQRVTAAGVSGSPIGVWLDSDGTGSTLTRPVFVEQYDLAGDVTRWHFSGKTSVDVPFVRDEWQQVAMYCEPGGNITAYRNGAPYGSTTPAPSVYNTQPANLPLTLIAFNCSHDLGAFAIFIEPIPAEVDTIVAADYAHGAQIWTNA